MKLVVTGGRNFFDEEMISRNIWGFLNTVGRISLIIHGNAPGLDQTFARVAFERYGIMCCPVAADWHNISAPGAVVRVNKLGRPYNAIAGHQRNQHMIDIRPDYAMIFPGGTGTADMVARIKRAGLPHWVAQ